MLLCVLILGVGGFFVAINTIPPAAPVPAPAAPVPAPEPAPAHTSEWAKARVHTYLEDLAMRPEALRYLADLYSECYFDIYFLETGINMKYEGSKTNVFKVYLKPRNRPSREYWDTLWWAVFEDGHVVEGSNNALRVKADLLELSQSP